jgi:hypothetical protein
MVGYHKTWQIEKNGREGFEKTIESKVPDSRKHQGKAIFRDLRHTLEDLTEEVAPAWQKK